MAVNTGGKHAVRGTRADGGVRLYMPSRSCPLPDSCTCRSLACVIGLPRVRSPVGGAGGWSAACEDRQTSQEVLIRRLLDQYMIFLLTFGGRHGHPNVSSSFSISNASHTNERQARDTA